VGVRTLQFDRHLDVGSASPDVATDIKGPTVLRIKRNVSWVHTVVKQVGFYLLHKITSIYRQQVSLSTRGLGKVDRYPD